MKSGMCDNGRQAGQTDKVSRLRRRDLAEKYAEHCLR